MKLGHRGAPWLDGSGTPAQSGKWPDDVFDVAVLGAGVFGATTALLLSERGLRVALLDAADPTAVSTTANSTSKVSIAQGTRFARVARHRGCEAAEREAAANLEGMTLLQSLATRLAPDCDLNVVDQVVYSNDPDTTRALTQTAEICQAAGITVRPNPTVDLPMQFQTAVLFPDQISIHPGRYLRAVIGGAIAAGAHFTPSLRATGISAGDLVEVETTGPSVRAERVVVATHSPFPLRGMHFAQLKAVRHYGVALKVRDPLATMTYGISSPTRSTRLLNAGDEQLMIVVGEGHDTGTGDIDTAGDGRWDDLVAWADEHFGVQAVRHHWAAQDYETPDSAPFIGRLTPLNNRVFMGSGFGGWGLGAATVAAEVVADMCQGQDHRLTDLWQPHRVPSPQSTATIAKWQAQVAVRLLGGLARGRLRTAEDLAEGEAEIFHCGVQQVAAYRDTSGVLHQVSARCTHLGCTVKWNSGEESWDCPCHGSRFAPDGTVLEAPAVTPLPTID